MSAVPPQPGDAGRPVREPLRCHRCGSADLVLNEVIHEHVRYEEGLYLDGAGVIRALGVNIRTPGDPQPKLTEIECLNCAHSWHPRRRFAGE